MSPSRAPAVEQPAAAAPGLLRDPDAVLEQLAATYGRAGDPVVHPAFDFSDDLRLDSDLKPWRGRRAAADLKSIRAPVSDPGRDAVVTCPGGSFAPGKGVEDDLDDCS